MPRFTEEQEAGFWSRVEKTDSCWLWTGATAGRGYGIYRTFRVHRIAYTLLVGPIPGHLQIDHLCRVHRCVNPAHLEPVDCRTNVLRGTAPQAVNALKTHCVQGHEFNEINTYRVGDRERMCRLCRKESRRRYWERKAKERAEDKAAALLAELRYAFPKPVLIVRSIIFLMERAARRNER